LNVDGSHPDGRVHQYFKKFPEISSYAGMKWSHLDLLMIRETKQAKVKKIYETERRYILTQLGIAKKSILESKPRVIVVCNAFACSLFERHLFKLRFDDAIGTYVVSSKSLRGTPVFFSGMLSGQRALDLGSLRRLKWHIKKIVQG
jgi:hypothetical protein